MLHDCIVGGIRYDRIRQKLLADPKLMLEKAEEICRASEKAIEGMNHLHTEKGKMESIQTISYNQNKPTSTRKIETTDQQQHLSDSHQHFADSVFEHTHKWKRKTAQHGVNCAPHANRETIFQPAQSSEAGT